MLYGLEQLAAHGFDAFVIRESGVSSGLGKRHVPVALLFDLESPASTSNVDGVARWHLPDPLEGGRAGNDRLHQLMVEAGGIEATRHLGMGEEDLQLGAEDEGIARQRVIEGLDAESIADQGEDVLLAIIEGEGELAAQLREHGFDADARREVQHDLGVALRDEACAAGRKLRANASVVVELAVLREQIASVLTREGLTPAVLVEVDDRESRMAHADAVEGLPPEPVGAAMVLDRGHGDQRFRVHGPGPVGKKDTGDATHGACSFSRS